MDSSLKNDSSQRADAHAPGAIIDPDVWSEGHSKVYPKMVGSTIHKSMPGKLQLKDCIGASVGGDGSSGVQFLDGELPRQLQRFAELGGVLAAGLSDARRRSAALAADHLRHLTHQLAGVQPHLAQVVRH